MAKKDVTNNLLLKHIKHQDLEQKVFFILFGVVITLILLFYNFVANSPLQAFLNGAIAASIVAILIVLSFPKTTTEIYSALHLIYLPITFFLFLFRALYFECQAGMICFDTVASLERSQNNIFALLCLTLISLPLMTAINYWNEIIAFSQKVIRLLICMIRLGVEEARYRAQTIIVSLRKRLSNLQKRVHIPKTAGKLKLKEDR